MLTPYELGCFINALTWFVDKDEFKTGYNKVNMIWRPVPKICQQRDV